MSIRLDEQIALVTGGGGRAHVLALTASLA